MSQFTSRDLLEGTLSSSVIYIMCEYGEVSYVHTFQVYCASLINYFATLILLLLDHAYSLNLDEQF